MGRIWRKRDGGFVEKEYALQTLPRRDIPAVAAFALLKENCREQFCGRPYADHAPQQGKEMGDDELTQGIVLTS